MNDPASFQHSKPRARAVRLPGCKSWTNRALLCAAAARGVSRISGVSNSDDAKRMKDLLGVAGVRIIGEGKDQNLFVHGLGGAQERAEALFDVADSGTVFRFLLPFVAAGRGNTRWTGTARMQRRPHRPLFEGLVQLGAKFHFETPSQTLPFVLQAHGLTGGAVSLASRDSSQFASGLLLASPLAREPIRIETTAGEGPVSVPYLEMTSVTQAHFGVQRVKKGETVSTEGSYEANDFSVPGDASAAFWFFAGAALLGKSLHLHNLGQDGISTQLSGIALGPRLGFAVRRAEEGCFVSPGSAQPFDLSFQDIPDLVPMAAILALFLPGTSWIRKVAHLRGKESDRLAALAQELSHCGAIVEESGNDLRIEGGRALHAASVSSHSDHRLAAAFWVLSQRVPGIVVDDLACISKSYPAFFDDFRAAFLDNRPQ